MKLFKRDLRLNSTGIDVFFADTQFCNEINKDDCKKWTRFSIHRVTIPGFKYSTENVD